MINDYEATQPIVSDAKPLSVDYNENVIGVLNGLIAVCKDGQSGYELAADGVQDENLKTLFREYAFRRSQLAVELQSLVQTLGGDPENSGSIAGSLRRGWMNIKAVVTGNDEGAILSECEKAEDSAKNAYEEAQEEDLPTYVREVVQNQYADVLAAHDNIRSLRDQAHNRSTSARSGS